MTVTAPCRPRIGLALSRRCSLPALLALATALTPAAHGAAPTVSGADLGAIVRRLDLQTDLPRVAEPVRWDFSLPPELVWAIAAVIAALLLVVLVQYLVEEFLHRGRGPLWPSSAAGSTAAAAGAAEAMINADELARHGRFIEAMHTLLLQALGELRDRLDANFADSLTSREILRHAPLAPPGQQALRDIIARVELTYFGARSADAGDYAACRASYAELAEALAKGDAA